MVVISRCGRARGNTFALISIITFVVTLSAGKILLAYFSLQENLLRLLWDIFFGLMNVLCLTVLTWKRFMVYYRVSCCPNEIIRVCTLCLFAVHTHCRPTTGTKSGRWMDGRKYTFFRACVVARSCQVWCTHRLHGG